MRNEIDEAVILAGGLGTRLNPLTNYRPKPLVPVVNYAMLDWNFLLLALNGIKKSIVVVNYLGDQIREHIKNFSSKIFSDMDIVIPDVKSKGTADALRAVADYVDKDNFFVTMADIITDIDLKQMGYYHQKKEGIATISLKSIYNNPKQFGVTLVDERNKIVRFLEKPSFNEVYLTRLIIQRRQNFDLQKNLINSGVYCFKSEILDILSEKNDLMDFGNNVFPFLLKKRKNMYGFVSNDYWQDCGKPDQLLMTNREVLNNNIPYLPNLININKIARNHALLKNSDCINNQIAIGFNVKIGRKTAIEESSINNHSKIGKHCSIRGSAIWENVKIGNNVVIENSIISNDSIIGNNCIIADGVIIKPGEKIPPNSIITS